MLSHLVRSKCSQPQESQWKGYNAVQYEIHGTFAASKIAFGYFLTIIEVKHHYIEVVGWAVEKNFDENAPTLRDAAGSVTYTGEQ
jgi:hydrogenase maturation factor HypF (carbamoyltransferase family)